ncbi:YndM family protein [Alkalibacillus salilacus]|uniref:DUF2512 family protein n=1 Tax=Alkalibacillus salilacus TaxID=284582 RepID=A0ABT9VET1_9BACI|nr:YndM family protein [Alkalibacillus salilacus]MDQ0159449.1 hypothetical protein [Alkalibacillus salilacus]
MNHIKLLLIKAVASFLLLYVILGTNYPVTFDDVLFITVILGALSYVIGDLLILLRTNNTVATISDFILSFMVVYFMLSMMTIGVPLFEVSLFAAFGITVFEVFFHLYVLNEHDVEPESRTEHRRPQQLQTEVSDELAPDYERERERIKQEKTREELADELNPDDFDEETGRPINERNNDDITDELNPDDFDQRKE